VHKARDAREVLDVGEVLDKDVTYENGEEGLTHQYPRSGVSEGDVAGSSTGVVGAVSIYLLIYTLVPKTVVA